MSDQPIVSNVTQAFYDRLAPQYDRFYQDWDETVRSEARFLQGIFAEFGFDASARILDCACGVGTQAMGLAALGYPVTGSDISAGELAEARRLRFGTGNATFRSDLIDAVFNLNENQLKEMGRYEIYI